MATQTASARPVPSDVEPFVGRAGAWLRSHPRLTSWTGIALVVGIGLFVWTMSSNRRSEGVASRQLQGARYALESENLPLAASELARIIENYAGTSAAGEARLLLAQVRLQQGQPQQAVEVLRDFARRAGAAYAAQAYGLLGVAYENLGQPREAGEAYREGAARARMPFLKAQLLLDAGRAGITAGDTAQAAAAYRRIIDELPQERAVAEAKVRLGELTRGT